MGWVSADRSSSGSNEEGGTNSHDYSYCVLFTGDAIRQTTDALLRVFFHTISRAISRGRWFDSWLGNAT